MTRGLRRFLGLRRPAWFSRLRDRWRLRNWDNRTWLEERVLGDGHISVFYGRCGCGWESRPFTDREKAQWVCGHHTGRRHPW